MVRDVTNEMLMTLLLARSNLSIHFENFLDRLAEDVLNLVVALSDGLLAVTGDLEGNDEDQK